MASNSRLTHGLLLVACLLLGACTSAATTRPTTTTATTAAPVTSSTLAPAAATTSNAPASLKGFVGSWSTHDGSIQVASDGTGTLVWPGATPPIGVGQTASVTVSPGPSGQATVTVTNGSLVYDGSTSVPAGTTYGPGSTLTLATTPFGLELSAAGQHLFSFCTAAERVSGQDQQYCGA